MLWVTIKPVNEMTLKNYDLESLRLVKSMIDEDLKIHLTIPELAHQANINEHKLKHGFKLAFGITIHAYRLKVRVQYAKVLLMDSDKPMKIIASQSGFKDVNVFNRSFKRLTGWSPGAWQKKHNKNV
jgi:AraC-like DNA-binding protein